MSMWKNQNEYNRYVEQYRMKYIHDAEYSAKNEFNLLELKYENAIIYSIVMVVIGGLIGGFSWILSKLPIISILIAAFDLHSIAILCCIIGVPWLIMSIIPYVYKKKRKLTLS